MGRLEEIISELLVIAEPNIDMEMTPNDVEAWDSLTQFLLIERIESEFDIKMDIEEIFSIIKIGDLYSLLSRRGVI